MVLAFQRKMGLAVVKFLQTALVGEGLSRVTFFAVGAELTLVLIFVTLGATFERYVGKLLKFLTVARFLFVAFDAGYIFVFPRERKVRFVVVEFFRWSEFFSVVAFRTVFSKRFLVHIFVTINAFLS